MYKYNLGQSNREKSKFMHYQRVSANMRELEFLLFPLHASQYTADSTTGSQTSRQGLEGCS